MTVPSRGAGKPPTQTKLQERVARLEGLVIQARSVGEALRDVATAVGEGDIDSLLALIVETTTKVIAADRATLYLLEDDKLVSRIKKGDELQKIVVELGQGVAGYVAQTGNPVRVRDAYDDDRFDPEWDKKSGYKTRGILAVPLRNDRGKMIGVLQVLNKRGKGTFTGYDTEMLQALANQAAVSLDKEALFQRLRTRNQ